MRYRKPFLLLFFFCFMVGCFKVGPNFTPPSVAVSQAWLDADDQRVKTEATEYRNWWQVFNDPVLDRLMGRAYQENLSLRVAGVKVLEVRAQLGIAVGELTPRPSRPRVPFSITE